MPETLHFKTNTLLKNLVGKDLINDDTIAVVELVKNARDAASESVLIRFEGFDAHEVTTPASRLIISDKGSGMGYADITDKWLNIAYSDKKLTFPQDGVYLAGNKGIGRFSCDRLGQHLDLLTRAKGGELYHLKVNWPDFEVEGQKDLIIQNIDVPLGPISDSEAERLANVKMPRHGTVLLISGLRSVWDREKLLALKRALEKFLSPNELFLKRKFQIDIEAKELKHEDRERSYVESVNGTVENQIFTNLRFNSTFIQSEITPDGKSVETQLSHEGDVVFRIKEKNDLNLKNVRAFIYYLNPYKKAYFKRETGRRSIDFGLIFLFLNGYRVAPYGDRGDDWLGLDVRKTQGTLRYLSSRDLVGRVEVIDEERSFEPVSSREGLKKTAAFLELKDKFILDVIRRLEKFVVEGLNWDSIPTQLREKVMADSGLDWKNTNEEYVESWDKKKQRIALSILTFIAPAPEKIETFWFNPSLLEGVYEQRRDEVRELLADVEGFSPAQIEPDLKRSLARLRKIMDQKEKEAQTARSEATSLRVKVANQGRKLKKLEKESDTYRAQTLFLQSVSSLDAQNLLAFHHEIIQNSNIIENYVGKVTKALRDSGDATAALQGVEKISLANRRILAIAQFATKANFKSSTGKELTDIPAFFEQYIQNVARDFVATGIDVDVANDVNEPFELRARRIELSILIDNVISNARKAQAHTLGVHIEKTAENALRVSFVDDGRGLSDQIKNLPDIFEAGITTTSGSGLGLYHAREIVRSLGGTISAVPRKPKGFEVIVELTR